MPSAFTHAIAATSLGTIAVPERKGLIALGAACSILPDADVIGFRIGIPYEHVLGHRGLSHSLVFATLLAALATWIVVRRARGETSATRVGLFLFLATASHGLLDALTNGGLGVAFFAPFSAERYFFPRRPIQVSPISLRRFMSGQGWDVLRSELLVVWTPAVAAALAVAWARRRPPTNR